MPLLRALGRPEAHPLRGPRGLDRGAALRRRLVPPRGRGAGGGGVARRDRSMRSSATRLGDLDAAALGAAGIPDAEIRRIRRAAADEAAEPLDPALRGWLLGATPKTSPAAAGPSPAFVARLAAQPRAGATCPGRGRLVLEPPENHAEHCADRRHLRRAAGACLRTRDRRRCSSPASPTTCTTRCCRTPASPARCCSANGSNPPSTARQSSRWRNSPRRSAPSVGEARRILPDAAHARGPRLPRRRHARPRAADRAPPARREHHHGFRARARWNWSTPGR